MIANLRETTLANQEQDWLKGNLARISGLMQGRRDLEDVAALIMSELTPGGLRAARRVLPGDAAGDGTRWRRRAGEDGSYELRMLGSLRLLAGPHADVLPARRDADRDGRRGEAHDPGGERAAGLSEDLLRARRGAAGACHRAAGALRGDQVLGVIELASFQPFTQIQQDFLNQIAEMIATSVNTISVNTKTEVLLKQSQELTEQLRERSAELENRQKALQASNAELEEKAELLAQAEPRHRGEEHRDRGGAAGPGGARRAARGLDALQVASSWRTCRTSCVRRSTRC